MEPPQPGLQPLLDVWNPDYVARIVYLLLGHRLLRVQLRVYNLLDFLNKLVYLVVHLRFIFGGVLHVFLDELDLAFL